jgi:hypothetical protein
VTAQIADVRDTNLTYLRAATRATQETLAMVGAAEPVGVYTGRGTHSTAGAFAHLFDRQG